MKNRGGGGGKVREGKLSSGGHRGCCVCAPTEQPRARSLLAWCLLQWLNNSGNSSDVKVIDRLFSLFAYARVWVRGENICRIQKCAQPAFSVFDKGKKSSFPAICHVCAFDSVSFFLILSNWFCSSDLNQDSLDGAQASVSEVGSAEEFEKENTEDTPSGSHGEADGNQDNTRKKDSLWGEVVKRGVWVFTHCWWAPIKENLNESFYFLILFTNFKINLKEMQLMEPTEKRAAKLTMLLLPLTQSPPTPWPKMVPKKNTTSMATARTKTPKPTVSLRFYFNVSIVIFILFSIL